MAGGASTGTHFQESIYSAFEESAWRHADGVALVAAGGRGRRYTFREVLSLAAELCAGLCGPRYAEIDQIGIVAENRPEWCVAYLAILAAGKTVVPIDVNLRPDEISFIIGDAGLKVIFASGRSADVVGKPGADLEIFCFEESAPNNWLRLRASQQDPQRGFVNETAVLIYTSGTTGAPKAVELTHRNLLSNLDGIRGALQFDENDTFLSVLPLHHTFEAMCGFLTPLTSGSTVVYARSLKSKELFEDIAANGVTIMCAVPLLFEKMYHAIQRRIASAPPGRRLLFRLLYGVSSAGWPVGLGLGKRLFRGLRRKAGLGTIRMFVSGGAALPPGIARFLNLIGFDFCQGYGMTECSPVISTNRPGDIKFGSVGPPLANLDVRIDSPDAAGVGEILVSGDSVTPGYRNNTDKTAETIVEGWLHTGDLGRFSNGHLWITGRRKNVIVSAAGKNVYPEELEERLLESNRIVEAVVFGRKKQDRQGEQVRALIVPDLQQMEADIGVSPDAPDMATLRLAVTDIVKEVNQRVAGYKRIVDFDIRLDELEKTSSRKIKRFLYT